MIAVFGKKRFENKQIVEHLVKHFSKSKDKYRQPIVDCLNRIDMKIIACMVDKYSRLEPSDVLLLGLLIERAGGVIENEIESKHEPRSDQRSSGQGGIEGTSSSQ